MVLKCVLDPVAEMGEEAKGKLEVELIVNR